MIKQCQIADWSLACETSNMGTAHTDCKCVWQKGCIVFSIVQLLCHNRDTWCLKIFHSLFYSYNSDFYCVKVPLLKDYL